MPPVVEFVLPGPEYEAIAWVHNEHFTGSVTPLEQSLGTLRPQRLAPDGLPGSIHINGYSFGRDNPMRPASEVPDVAVVAGWRERRLPAVEAACAMLDAFDPAAVPAGEWRATLEAQEQGFWEAFGGVHRDTMGQVFPASALWVDEYVARFGEESRLDAVAMLAGFPNASTERAAALWQLSRLAEQDEEVLRAIRAGQLPSSASPGGREFRAGFDALLAQYGYTTTMHLIDLPTWREDPTIPLAMIAAMAGESAEHDPLRTEAASAARREQLESALRALDTGDEAIARLQAILVVARYLAPASEDHNLLCDQRMIAASRARWLRIGEQLHAWGRLGDAAAVFYLTTEELLDMLEGGVLVPEDRIEARRADQAAWRATAPPARLGSAAGANAGLSTLRGIAVSRGVYRGRARVVVSLDQAGRLEAGDVLVCPATSPEWTPYFGVARALVSATGSLLAHAAVVAREFGIPAVVGVTGATSQIPDGATILVDGTRGLVTIEQAPTG